MDYFPFFVKLDNKHCVIIGGGDTAMRKAKLIAKTKAKITVVAPEISSILQDWAQVESTSIHFVQDKYRLHYIENAFVVIAATNDVSVNQQIAEACEQRDILVNVVDMPKACRFIVPSIVDRSPITIALSSGGKAPVLLRHIRTQLESIIPANLGKLASFAGKMRSHVAKKIHSIGERRKFWDKHLSGPIAEDVMSGFTERAEQRFLTSLDGHHSTGCVYLIGAGPGDPELLTFKALRLMQQADVVLYDRLVSKEILELVRRDADMIYVGKKAHQHELPQAEINAKLVELASEGNVVVRLKGGDPFIFGRGGEEIIQLSANKIPFQVVPGITAAAGAASYAGIPLTHREHAQAISFVTGHSKHGEVDLNWEAITRPNHTLVIYMGLCQLSKIIHKLIEHGLEPQHPIAVISKATYSTQETVCGNLGDIECKVKASNIESPALFIVGSVVSLREKLSWFEQKHETLNATFGHVRAKE
ncbi:MAG: siroheme synthase CysG [Pseudomonadota bacterium]